MPTWLAHRASRRSTRSTPRRSIARPPRSCATAALAEDVVQEVFERVWRGSGHDEHRGPLGPYLTLLARSRALDLRRRSRTGERILHRLGEQAGALRRPSPPPEAEVARATERRLARAAVRRLPDEQRQAIGLAYWGGLSARELAAAEEIPFGTAKTRVRLGLAKLVARPRAGGRMRVGSGSGYRHATATRTPVLVQAGIATDIAVPTVVT